MEETFGGRIRKQRVNVGLTQKALAEMLAVRRNTIGNWENGRSKPERDTLERAAEALKCSPQYLEFGQQADTTPFILDEGEPVDLFAFVSTKLTLEERRLLERHVRRKVAEWIAEVLEAQWRLLHADKDGSGECK